MKQKPDTTNTRPSHTLVYTVIVIIVIISALAFWLYKNKNSVFIEPATLAPETPITESAIIANPTSPVLITKTYSLSEVALHNSATDCWTAIEGKVYDVTYFVDKHSGGGEILKGCGKDATTLFNKRPTYNNRPHPTSAQNFLQQFYIGDLEP